MNKLRMHCVEVTVNSDLSVSYRLTLPVKKDHIHLLDHTKVQTFVRCGKPRYNFVVESNDRSHILQQMEAAQLIITEQKIKELQLRQECLLYNLANGYEQK